MELIFSFPITSITEIIMEFKGYGINLSGMTDLQIKIEQKTEEYAMLK